MKILQNLTSFSPSSKSVPDSDQNQLIDLKNFKFLITPPETVCDVTQNASLVVLVTTGPENFRHREVIRETWGSCSSNQSSKRVIFFMGSVNSSEVQEKIRNESEIYKDIVQGNYDDTYRNLTYKTAMIFKWFVYKCPNVQYLLKVDDDVFVNLPLLNNHLDLTAKQNLNLSHTGLMFCK